MANDGAVTLAGALGADPTLRFTAGGKGVASFSVAVSRRWQQNGEWQEQTSWVRVTAWGQMGEHCAQSLTKGSRVVVTGRLEQAADWTDKDGHEQRGGLQVVADEVAASLRWANVEIQRVTRERNDESQHTSTGRSSSGGRAAPKPDPIYGDDEAF